MEIAELEKSYQEQRKRLLNEVHAERLRQERENDVTLAEKQRALEQKFEKLVAELQGKINEKNQEFQVIRCEQLCARLQSIAIGEGSSGIRWGVVTAL